MTTSHLYRSLTINERKQQSDINPIEKHDLELAKTFWNNILEGTSNTYIEEVLKEHYNIGLDFLVSHFHLENDSKFNFNDEWYEYICQQVKGIKSFEDPEFDQMDLSSVPFYAFFEPFLKEFYFDLFHNKIKHLNDSITYSCKNDIIKCFIDMLYAISHKTLILEINSLRLMGKLKGDTPQERYTSYYRILQEDEEYKTSFYQEYPVLFRTISTKIVNFKRFLLEVFTNYEQDKLLLQETYNINIDLKIKHLHLGSGDSHKKGKTVTILEFDNGQKVVYKPRSLSIDIEFQNFIKWLNNKNIKTKIKLKTIHVIDKKHYGWSEFVSYKECNSEGDISRFYNRVGQLLGVLHLMNATDFHYENLISHGEFPVLIDLESLFHHTISADHSPTKSEVVNKALRLINDSVLTTGLIPNRILKANDKTDFDVSGIGNTLTEQELPIQMGVVTDQLTDEVRIEKRNGRMAPGLNTPRMKGKKHQIGDYLDDIINGFTLIYDTFSANKKELKHQILRFKGKEIRKIFRDTMKYSSLLTLSYHPDFMRNQIDREMLLNRLRVKKDEVMVRVVDFEIADMLECDIPYFTSTPESTSIRSSNQNEITNFYNRDGLSLSLDKIERLSPEDLRHQLSIITATISAVYSESDIKLLQLKNNHPNPMNSNEIIVKSEEVAEILLDNAIVHEGEAGQELCWASMVTKGGSENTWVYSVTGPGLYDGNPGIAVYFSYLWKVTQNHRYKQAAYASLRPIRKLMSDLVEPENVNLGSYLGISGIVYSLHHLGEVFNDNELKLEALTNAKLFYKFIKHDKVYDLIGGSSGALMVILNLYEQYREDWMLDIGEELCQHLINNATPQNQGIAWHPGNTSNDPYIGFSHGNAGIVSALARFYKYRPSLQIQEVIHQAIEYENTHFNNQQGNWFSAHLQKYPIAWCHGAPGILLSRCILKECGIFYKELERDITSAYKTTIESQTGKNYSFCHGDLGLVDILMVADEKLSITHEEVNNFKRDILTRMLSSEQIQADINSVGLLNGIASIGYGLLRAAEPGQIPSMLVLDSPNK